LIFLQCVDQYPFVAAPAIMTPSQIASMLGRLAAGRPKKYSAEELKRRTERLHRANRLRRLAEKKKKSRQ
jgi:hypothetical protein